MSDLFTGRLERVVWTVAALVQAVSDALATRFASCTVRGEISGFSRAASGHCYFNLKDAQGSAALIRCVMFRRALALLDFSPGDGQLVELRGRLGVYEGRGELQFVAEAMRRAGDGALFEQFVRLKVKLEREGLFDAARKRPIPQFPRRVGIVTSLAGAALHDVTTTLMRRAPHVAVVVYPSSVQGAEAPAALCHAMTQAARHGEVDSLIVARGGGSLQDLWAFNDESVVRAVAALPMPVISGIGHETDVTLVDFAADLRAPTPTAAAELAAPDAAVCLDRLAVLGAQLRRRVHAAQDQHAQRIDRLASRLARPADGVRRRGQQLQLLEHRLHSALQRRIDRCNAEQASLAARRRRSLVVALAAQARHLGALQARLEALDPNRVLARGYAWLADECQRAVVSIAQVEIGAPLQAVLSDGSASVRVLSVSGLQPMDVAAYNEV